MKLVSFRANKGLHLPGINVNGADQSGLRMNTLPKPAEEVFATGWQLHLRGPLLLLESPAVNGKRRVYMRPVTDFDLGFELDEGEAFENFQRWDSHPPTEAKGARK